MNRPASILPRDRRHPLALLSLLFTLMAPACFAADVFNGNRIYQTYCEACHGNTGQGAMPGTPNFSRGQGLLQPDLALLNRIESGKNAMPAFQGVLENEEMLDVIAYLRTFF